MNTAASSRLPVQIPPPASQSPAKAQQQQQPPPRSRPAHHSASQTTQFSLRKPTWAYIRLQHLGGARTPQELDGVTAHLHLMAALTAFLGQHGAAIAPDILKLDGADVWVRVPADDRAAVLAAVGGWVKGGTGEGWRVKGWSAWSAHAGGKDGGQDLFG